MRAGGSVGNALRRFRGNVVWRLLGRNISVSQMLGYALSNVVGFSIVLVALQFYVDVTALSEEDDAYISSDYLVVSKKVQGLGSLLGPKAEFNDEEIDDIRSQEWARSVGLFTASEFGVDASVAMAGQSLSTALFFESIPDEFFDVLPCDWTFDPDGDNVPIVISKDYLALYNFGFAPSRGLPQISEEMVCMVPLRICVSGNGHRQYFDGRVVGFSSRLNTIAVPDGFMRWANEEFAPGVHSLPSRLIIKADNTQIHKIDEYLDAHGYESAGDLSRQGKMSYLLVLITTIVVAVGVVISLLAFFILLLSVHLLLLKNRDKIRTLILLGYTPGCVASYYYVLVAAVNLVVISLSLAITLGVRMYWLDAMGSIGTVTAGMWLSVVVGLLAAITMTLLNVLFIKNNIRKSY